MGLAGGPPSLTGSVPLEGKKSFLPAYRSDLPTDRPTIPVPLGLSALSEARYPATLRNLFLVPHVGCCLRPVLIADYDRRRLLTAESLVLDVDVLLVFAGLFAQLAFVRVGNSIGAADGLKFLGTSWAFTRREAVR